MTNGSDRRTSYRLLLMMLWTTLLVLAVQSILGWASTCLSLLAGSLHTLIDGFSTGLSLLAVSSPQRTLGREIWGHGRVEVALTLMLNGFLSIAGVSLIVAAIQQMEAVVRNTPLPYEALLDLQRVQIMAAMVILLLGVALFNGYQGRELSSLALRLNTQHILQDGWLSIGLLLGLLGIWRGYHWLDPLLALAFVGLSVRSFWRVLKQQLPMLLRPTAIAPEALAEIVNQTQGVTRCTKIRSRGMVGRQVWVELHLALHPEFMDAAHEIGQDIESEIRQRYGPVRAQIWVEESSPFVPSFEESSPYLSGQEPGKDWS